MLMFFIGVILLCITLFILKSLRILTLSKTEEDSKSYSYRTYFIHYFTYEPIKIKLWWLMIAALLLFLPALLIALFVIFLFFVIVGLVNGRNKEEYHSSDDSWALYLRFVEDSPIKRVVSIVECFLNKSF